MMQVRPAGSAAALLALAVAVNEVLPHIELRVSGYLHSGKKIWGLIT
jgi:hypothetical protein